MLFSNVIGTQKDIYPVGEPHTLATLDLLEFCLHLGWTGLADPMALIVHFNFVAFSELAHI